MDDRDTCFSDGYCGMKPLFSPFESRDILGGVAILIGAAIAAGGGLGGK